jgi:ketosteroid isomerase-like protein
MTERADYEHLVRAGTEAFNRGDLRAILPLLAEDVECYIPIGLGNPGTWHGHDGFLEMAEGWSEVFADIHNDVVSTDFPDERHALVEIRQSAVGAGSGVPVEKHIFYLFGVRDLRLTRFHVCADRAAALAAIEDSRE